MLAVLVTPTAVAAQGTQPPPIIGRWDLLVTGPDGAYPSWLEVSASGYNALVGRFVGQFGSARPIGQVHFADGVFGFSIPRQWEEGTENLRLEGRVDGDALTGTVHLPSGAKHPFTGVRAPALQRTAASVWGEEIQLFNGRDLSGWTTEGTGGGSVSHWKVVDGVLTNAASGANLRTERTFGDFRLRLEFRYPRNGNSGIYLRGRHEVQVEDSPVRELPSSLHIGGVYGFLPPNEYAAKGPGEWQTYEITLVGRRVTVVLNGRAVIVDQVIPGITGGALDSDEGAPGPILLQGDHTAVEYRNIRIIPGR